MSQRGGVDVHVLVFFLCFFFLFSSGRIASMDAGQQLQASVLLAVSGGLSDDGRGGGPSNEGWVRAPNQRFYQAHDIGNVILMLPAAWLGARLSAAPPAADVLDPPPLSRAGASLACAALAALGCCWMFRLFALYWRERVALVLSILFPTTTILIAYARAAWDVLGGCAMICGVLYYSAALLRGYRVQRSALMLAVTTAIACSFRFSLAPFVPPAACVILLIARSRISVRTATVSAASFSLLILPSLAYNFVRTGSPIRPATASDQYLHGANALTGSVLHGLYGLFLSPNRSLFLFSPVLVLSAIAVWKWRTLKTEQRQLLAVYGAAALAYALLISKMANWGAFGWGPRYLLPVLPVVFLATAHGLLWLWRASRPAAVAVTVISAATTLPPAVVNWHLATTSFAHADDADASGPYQLRAGWMALLSGLRGQPLPVPPNAAHDALRATTSDFPDLFLARMAMMSRSGLLAAIVAAGAALFLAAASAARVLRITSVADAGDG